MLNTIKKMENWKCVYTTDQEYQAELVMGCLTNENIEALIFNKKDSAYTIYGDVEVYVNPEDETKAIALLKEHKF